MMTKRYLRPILKGNYAQTTSALRLGGGWLCFEQLEELYRDGTRKIIPVSDLSDSEQHTFCAERTPMAGLSYTEPLVMGILNATPDSFSDGGDFSEYQNALHHAREMHRAGADIIDIGGESTRPGADFVEPDTELNRTLGLTQQLAKEMPLSIDTRKASVARANLNAGAVLFNDVTALSYDENSLKTAIDTNAYVCLMHSPSDPKTMQNNAHYNNVVLDIYDYLTDRIALCEAAGLSRKQIIIDPGIGFGKTLKHNLMLIRDLALFHALGCPILFGASRKRMIDKIANVPEPKDRLAGSIALALAAVAQGAQIIRVHDVAQSKQAIAIWQAIQSEGINA